MQRDGSLIFDTKIDESGFYKGISKLKDVANKSMAMVTQALKAGAAALAVIITRTIIKIFS